MMIERRQVGHLGGRGRAIREVPISRTWGRSRTGIFVRSFREVRSYLRMWLRSEM